MERGPTPVAERAAFYAAIERPFYFAWGLSVVAAFAWLVILLRRRPMALWWARWLVVVLFGLAIAQPAWWMDSMRGDCGMARDLAALQVAALSIGLLAFGAWRRRVADMLASETGSDLNGD